MKNLFSYMKSVVKKIKEKTHDKSEVVPELYVWWVIPRLVPQGGSGPHLLPPPEGSREAGGGLRRQQPPVHLRRPGRHGPVYPKHFNSVCNEFWPLACPHDLLILNKQHYEPAYSAYPRHKKIYVWTRITGRYASLFLAHSHSSSPLHDLSPSQKNIRFKILSFFSLIFRFW